MVTMFERPLHTSATKCGVSRCTDTTGRCLDQRRRQCRLAGVVSHEVIYDELRNIIAQK